MKKGQHKLGSEGVSDRSLGFAVYDAARLWTNEIDRRMKHFGLTRTQWRVLVHLNRNDGMTQTDLSDQLGVGKVSLGGVLGRLESAGWVHREVDTADSRAKRVYLTDNFKPLGQELTRIATAVRGDFLKGIPSEDVEKLMEILHAIKSNALKLNQAKN